MRAFLSVLGLLFSLAAFADMVPVTEKSPALVKEYSSGICSVGFNETGTKCCTGFRIAEDLVMTNFHCLACVDKIFKTLLGSTPIFMEPSKFLYSIPSDDPVYINLAKEKLRSSLDVDIDYDKFYLPSNDDEFMKLMNTYPELLTNINFKNTIDNEGPLLDSTHRIKEIIAMNLYLDYSIIRVEGLDDSEKILKLSGQRLYPNQKLAVMGHPSKGPYPNKKVYDISDDCKVLEPLYDAGMYRMNVFTHKCSTASGSSGSPIVDRNNGRVLGIHWGAQNDKDFRLGIDMKSILKDLAEKGLGALPL